MFPASADELFENIHMVLFMVMVIFLASNVFLAKKAKSVVRTAAEWEQSSFNGVPHNRAPLPSITYRPLGCRCPELGACI